ncbi:MAG TPA: hypothetical protein VFL64_16445 [Rhizobacter sp.]|nr:hypothetical protein [Rhizobacter sp.]
MTEQADDEPRSRARWLGVVLLVLALGGVAWQAWVSGFGDEPPAGAMPSGSVRQPTLREMLGRIDAARLGLESGASATSATAAKLTISQDEVEVCGQGRKKVDDNGQLKDMAPVQLAAQAARDRLLPALLGSPDETSRAAGLLLQTLGAPGPGDAAAPTSHLLARDTLASMALSTRSPQVYAWAMRACQNERSEGMCQLLSADQWARLEPSNAVAWLQVAVDAQARLDAAGVAEAMYRVSQASRVDAHWNGLTGLVMARLPAEMPALDKGALVEELMTLEASVATPHLIASQFCTEADVRDANRRQTCSAVADVFHARGTTLTDVGLAAALGERVGWPAERVDAVRDERDAVLHVYKQRAADVRERWTCGALDKTARRMIDVSQQGEIAVMRRTLKEQPENAAALARRYRESVAKPPPGGASGAVSVAVR